MKYWNFPAVAGGNINSLNNAGLETFRDNPIDSLTREISQNSLDAVKDSTKPVIIEFNKFICQSIPNKDELKEAYKKCEETWSEGNERCFKFIKTALNNLEKESIQCLRISDFNTLGLKGAKEAKLGSPWSSLIKESGSSNKGDDSGGSFGIGKAAPFLSSDVRTVFYSTFDEECYKSHIGVADIMSFKKEDNKITLGKGYYTNSEDSLAIEGLLNLDSSFDRTEPGTDIFIICFNGDDDWKKEIIQSVIRNFCVTIYQKQLIIKVEGFTISYENIVELIEQLEENEENQVLKQYFKLLSSNDTIRITYPSKNYSNDIIFEEGEAELLLKSGEDLNRRVLMTRKNGMRIYEQNNISGSISFTGLLLMKGKNINKVFKEMENPTHNAWLPNRYTDNPKLAGRIFSDLRKFLRDKVKETFQQASSDTMNAVGLSDFLPNKKLLDDNGRDKVESIQTLIKSIESKEIDQYQQNVGQVSRSEYSKSDEQILGEFGISPDEPGWQPLPGVVPGPGPGPEPKPWTEPGFDIIDIDKEGNRGIDDIKVIKAVPLTNKFKYACRDKMNGQYRFLIDFDKPILRGYLKFTVIGEQSNFDLPIKHARFEESEIAITSISGNNIYFTASEKKKSLKLNIQIEYSDYCVMEVGVYEDK